MKRIVTIITAILLIVANQSSAQNDVLAEISDIPLETVRSAGFTLEGDQQVRIEAVGAGDTRRELAANAWILNAQTRKVVWEMLDTKSGYRSRRLHEIDDRLLRGAVVPRRQRVGLGVRAHDAEQQCAQHHSHCMR